MSDAGIAAPLTPMMQQYRQAKAELPADVLLLFRLGDFYEMFFDDAVRGSKLLDIVLTRRQGVPMAGIPFHALQNYLPRLLEAGLKVAVAEQMEDPRFAKGLVKREITQVITPGTVLDSALLTAGRSNFLVSVCRGKKGAFGVASLELSTAAFRLTQIETRELLDGELNRLQPAEVLLPEALHREWSAAGFPELARRPTWTPIDDWLFDEQAATDALLKHFGVASLDGFGCREFPLGVSAAGAVLHYAQNNLRRNAQHVTALAPYATGDHLLIDRISQRNLELVEPLFADTRHATLLSVLDHTVTPMGSRLLREWILRPLIDLDAINARLDAVNLFVNDPLLLAEFREALGAVKDLERTIARLNVGSANGRDLLVLAHGLEAFPGLKAILAAAPEAARLRALAAQLCDLPALVAETNRALVDDPPLAIREGGLIRAGYNAALDELHRAATDGKSWIADLQAKEQERTSIKSLKVRFNKVFGYYLEVSKPNLNLVPADYIRKQTLVNAERFVTPALKEIEDKILGAEDKSKALEYELFQELRAKVVAETAAIQAAARALAELDTLASLADVAARQGYTRPELTDDLALDIRDGRHPVVEQVLRDERFVPNDVALDGAGAHMVILTGPNMAGKSTYIRQVALIALMAQMGSYVPAASARLGWTDRVFTRIGAADDLARGQSTFMVEMLETANILRNATARSLVILDEIGRGTSTFDGLSIAWAVAEHLHLAPGARARTLFATHYHELTALAEAHPGIVNCNVAVREWGEKVVFLHKIMPGAADKSYGIHVARLAGLPKSVLDRAREVLVNLEGGARDQADRPRLARHRAAAPPAAATATPSAAAPAETAPTRVPAAPVPAKPPTPPQPMLFEY